MNLDKNMHYNGKRGFALAVLTAALLGAGQVSVAATAGDKAVLIRDVIADHRIDLVGVTETWIFLGAPDAIKLDIAPFGYRVLHAHR